MRRLLAVTACLFLSACVTAQVPDKKTTAEPAYLKKVLYTDLKGWQQDDMASAIPALQKSCAVIMKKDKTAEMGSFAGAVADWQGVCEKLSLLMLPTDAEARTYFEQYFTPYQLSSSAGADGLFTGYYEPLLHGSLEKKDKYTIPLYARPDDLITVNLGDFKADLKGQTITGRVDGQKLIPYFKRADIEAGAIDAQQKQIVYVDNAVDAFFLHIQGSGQVQMQDGTILRVGYAAQNGHPYLAIGKALIEKGALTKENVSMQSIRAWLEANPDQAAEVMNLNASYVFFQKLEGDGPLGAQGVALTPRRSMAVDHRYIPYGAPLWIDAKAPEGDARIERLMIAQDTGGAIRGVVRGDYFWGAGEDAAHMAGIMKSAGSGYVLLPKTVVIPKENEWHMFGNASLLKSFAYNE